MRTRVAVLALAALLAAGCSKKDNGSSGSTSGGSTTGAAGSTGTSGTTGAVDSGPQPCHGDAECTAPGELCQSPNGQSGVCGPKCQFDDQCDASSRCDEVTGHCIPGDACNDTVVTSPSAACLGVDSGYCGTRCRCETADAGPGDGVCKRVRAYCEPCATDDECNPCPAGAVDCDPSKFVYPARCADVGTSGKFCLRVASAQGCPFGYVQDPGSGACQPQSGSCSGNPQCGSDADCLNTVGPGHYCETNTGICKEFCKFNFDTGESVNCPPSEVCNVLPRFVLPDAGQGLYGVGNCGAPCDQQGGTNCTTLAGSSGLDFQCVAEKGGEHRCRPVSVEDGGVTCMNDKECPHTTDGGVYAGYCALYQFSCNYDCRVGIDPVSLKPYSDNDCVPSSGSDTSYKCVASQCVEKNCVERGGAAQNGKTGQLCCGEDRNHTGLDDAGFADISDPANACIPGVDAGQFFAAPSPPWCGVSCDPNPGPANGFYPDGGYPPLVTCDATLAGLPDFDPLGSPNFCLQYTQQGAASCLIAAQYATECPKGWSFGGLNVGCGADADCDELFPDGGASGLGHCNVLPDGGGPHTCTCSQPEAIDGGGYVWGGQCPNLTRCDTRPTQGVRSCIITRGCLPNAIACP